MSASEQKPVLIWAGDLSGLMAAYLLASQNKEVSLFCEDDLVSVGSEYLSPTFPVPTSAQDFHDFILQKGFLSFADSSVLSVVDFTASFSKWVQAQFGSNIHSDQNESADSLLHHQVPVQNLSHAEYPIELILQRYLVHEIQKLVQNQKINLYQHWLWIQPIQSDKGRQIQGVVGFKKQSSEFYVFKSNAVITGGESYHHVWSNAQHKSWNHSGCFLNQVYRTSMAPVAQMEFIEWNPFVEQHNQISTYKPQASVCLTYDDSTLNFNGSVEDLWTQALMKTASPLDWTAPSSHWAVTQTYGGLYTDSHYQTPLQGLYAIGNSTSRSRGDQAGLDWSLLQKVASATRAVQSICQNQMTFDFDHELQIQMCEQALTDCQKTFEDIIDLSGPQNIFKLQNDFNHMVAEHVKPGWNETKINFVLDEVMRFQQSLEKVGLSEKGKCFNQEYQALLCLQTQLDLLEAYCVSALVRQESRGWSLRSDYPERDDSRYKKQTRMFYNPQEPRVSFSDSDFHTLQKQEWA